MSDGGTFTAQWLCSKCKQPIEGSYRIVGSQALCAKCASKDDNETLRIAAATEAHYADEQRERAEKAEAEVAKLRALADKNFQDFLCACDTNDKLRALCKEAGEALDKMHGTAGQIEKMSGCKRCDLIARLRAAGEGK